MVSTAYSAATTKYQDANNANKNAVALSKGLFDTLGQFDPTGLTGLVSVFLQESCMSPT